MKRNWKNSLLPATMLVVMLALVAACNKGEDHAAHADTYTCPMHPTVISDKPGTCPVCAMDLVRKARAGEEVEITEELSKLLKSPNEAVIASIQTVKGEYKSIPISIKAQGVVTYDTRNIYTIPIRIGGRLEKVFLKYAFQRVQKGQKVAEIYSPELLTAQRDLLFLLENDSENKLLIQSAKDRLKLLGVNDSQINSLIENKEPKNTFTIYSPYNGYIIPDKQPTPLAPMSSQNTSGSGMGEGMGGSTSNSLPTASGSSSTITGDALLREGSYVAAGQTLFKIVNPSGLRIELNIASALAGAVKKGGKVLLDFGDQHSDEGTIDFIQPFFNEGQEFLTIRVYTKSKDRLHIGHFVKAVIESGPIEALWVPKEAVLHLGNENIVFIKEKNVFKPRKIVTSIRTENQIEVKKGLSSSDEIAVNAQYLVDSESFIKANK
jgi:multidrug efflux pump subunit AcrA (membrane-fusion protein)